MQQRINYSHASAQLVEHICQEIAILRDQLLPSMEILHFLVEKPAYQVRNKLNLAAKKIDIGNTALNIKFTVSDKVNSVTYLAECWNMTVV